MTRRDRPLICLVTDRRRAAPGATTWAAARDRLLALAREAVSAGVDLLQVREPELDTTSLVTLVRGFVDAARGSATRVVVNDRLDVALACGAGGVHLRSDSIPPTAARSIAPEGFLVGQSIHSVAEAEAYASSADYVIAGTVYPTASKPGQPRLLGPAGLAAIVRATTVPVLGIGGVTAGNLDEVVASGAAGIAAIGLFLSAPIAEAVAAIRAAFDITKAAS